MSGMRPAEAALGSVLALLPHPDTIGGRRRQNSRPVPLLVGVLRGWRVGHNIDTRVVAQGRQQALHEFASVQGKVTRYLPDIHLEEARDENSDGPWLKS